MNNRFKLLTIELSDNIGNTLEKFFTDNLDEEENLTNILNLVLRRKEMCEEVYKELQDEKNL